MRPSRQRPSSPRRAVRRIALLGTASLLGAIPSPVSAQTRLVTVNRDGSGTANGSSAGSAFSADGRFMVFVSSASDLLSSDTSGQNVYVRDLLNGTTTLVSINHAGDGGANGQCFSPVISADGRFVAFESTANNLVATDTNGQYGHNGQLSDIFVRDLRAGVTTLVSVNRDGTDTGEDASSLPAITPDGSAVAFRSSAKNLVTNPATPCIGFPSYVENVYVRYLPNGPTHLVSASTAGNHGCGESGGYLPPSISADGRYVAFTSTAFDLTPNDTNGYGMEDVFVRDLQTGTTTLVSVNLAGDTGSWLLNNRSEYALMSADGRFVAFTSYAPDLVINDSNGRTRDVFVRDMVAQVTSLVSVTASDDGSGNGFSLTQAITPDGRFVAFYSHATDLVSIDDVNGHQDVFVRDLQNGTTTAASVSEAETTTGNGSSFVGGISADGRFVTFQSDASDLVANDGNGSYDVFVRDLQAGTTALVSTNATGTASGNNGSSAPLITQDGALVAFTSLATDLTELPDGNGSGDVFIRSRVPTLADLIALLQSFGLPKGLENSLASKLENALKSLDAGKFSAACGQIAAFIGQLEAQSGKELTTDQANQLIAAAGSIRTSLGCS